MARPEISPAWPWRPTLTAATPRSWASGQGHDPARPEDQDPLRSGRPRPPCRADACPVQRALVRAPRGKGLRIHRRVWLTVPEGQSPCLLGSPRLRPPDCAEAAWKLGIELQEVGCRPWRKARGARHQDRASAGCTREGRCASLSGRPRLGRPTDPRGAESGQGAGGLLPGPTWEPSGGSAAQDPGAGRQSSPPSSVGDTRP